MSGKQQDEAPEVVIVRRKRGGDDCHHGGVWKVAYADFMTAMMAFFLVMWLINAANEATKAQVASYFNPVKLVDTTTNPRGLQDSQKSSSGDVQNKELKSEAYAKADDHEANAEDNKQLRTQRKRGPAAYLSGGDISETDLFRDPVHTLDRIAGGAPDLLKGSAQPERRQETLGAVGGQQFRDPFSPRSWESLEQTLPEDVLDNPAQTKRTASARRQQKAGQQDQQRHRRQEQQQAGQQKRLARLQESPAVQHMATSSQAARQSAHQPARQQGTGGHAGSSRQQPDKEVKALRQAIARALAAGSDPARQPEVSVRREADGILISLMDKDGFGMFDVGSARPRPQVVRLMERIAHILKNRPGMIVVRGHTDGRPFRNRNYDNWRLSTARAHMARYMLLRGGIPAQRILRVEGYADRKLAVPGDPLAARNRRIEILLKEKGK